MATSGSFNTTSYDVRYLTFSWTLDSQSIADNSSTISWSLKGAGGSATKYYYTGNFKVVIEGEIVYQSKDAIQLKHQTVASGKKTIYHGSDGKKTFTASASAGIYYSQSNNSTGSGSWELTQIPRQATITSAPNFNDEENPVMKYDNPAGNNVTLLEACIADEKGQSPIVGYRNISKTGNSYTFNLTESERNALLNHSANANSKPVGFYIHTVMAGKDYYSHMLKTLSIINAHPTLNPTATDVNSETTAVTGDANKFIKYQSNVKVSSGASAKKGATIVSQKITNGSKVITSGSGTFNAVESGDFVFSVTDSRGNTTTQTMKKTFYNYVNPTVSITSTKLSAEGVLTISFTGNLYNGTLGKANNKHFAYYRYKQPGTNYTDWKPVTDKIVIGNYQTYTVTAPVSGFDYTKSYTVQAAIEDSLEFVTSAEKVVSSKPVYDWGKDDFRFNCSTISGPVFSIGGIPEKNFINVGDDFNNYMTPGIYCVGQSEYMGNYADGSPKIKNKPPIVVAGRLVVISGLGDAVIGGTWSYVTQEFHPYSKSPKFKRHGSTGSTPNKWTWSDWVVELNSDYTDYVIAQGTSNGWDYVKWNSGRAECIKRLWCGNCPRGQWGSMYSYALTGSRQTLPFKFRYIPVVEVTLEPVSANAWLATRNEGGSADESHTPAFQCVRPTDGGASMNMILDYHVFGFWK